MTVNPWLAEAAIAADQINDRESLACGSRDSGRTKSLHGARDDPSLTAKQNGHSQMLLARMHSQSFAYELLMLPGLVDWLLMI